MNIRFIYISILFLLGFCCNQLSAQTIQIYLENFNNTTNDFLLNNGGPGTNGGTNQWVVTNDYTSQGVYPNTTPQTSTAGSGTITQPGNNYLHIFDAISSPVDSNCNYNNTIGSDNFARMGSGFCTLAMTNVHFTFFYIAEGNANDYGRLYYRIDGGAWTQCGAAKYFNQTLWKYEDISLPVFDNHYSVEFGFRWTNSSGSGANVMSFGVDDVIAVGDYDTRNPVDITVTSVSPNPACEGDDVTLGYKISKPLCDGTYSIEMSNAAGNFGTSPTNLGVFTIYAGDTTGFVFGTLPKASGTCFKFRISRNSPDPVIVGKSSTVCLEVKKCPVTITTRRPSVTLGPDTLCTQSAIDVPFNSTGTFGNNNTYTAQLSDKNGSFASPKKIGASPDPDAYPFLPGTVSGLVPDVSPGCGYYIRVISSSPAYTPTNIADLYGPFCIRQCDALTNETKDVQVCVNDTAGQDVDLLIDIHSYNNNAQYAPGNQFIVQLLRTSNYTVVNTGGLGAVVSTSGTSMTMHVPDINALAAMGIQPGVYYLRFISNNSNSPSDTLGTLIRLTIGYESPVNLDLYAYDGSTFLDDSVFCPGDIAVIGVPWWQYDFRAKYQWKSKFNFGLGQPFYYQPDLGVGINVSTPPGKYWFICREDIYGCFSPWSDTLWITVLSKPNVNITGTTPLCEGDTCTLKVPFQDDTYYEWKVYKSTEADTLERDIIDKSNNQTVVVFNQDTVWRVYVEAVNACGSNTNTKNFTVYPKPDVEITALPPDLSGLGICQGKDITLSANTNGIRVAWFSPDSMSNSTSLNIIADSADTYILKAATNRGCLRYDTIQFDVHPNPNVALDLSNVSCFGGNNGTITALVQDGTPPYSYTWNNAAVTPALDSLEVGLYAVTITDIHACVDMADTTITSPPPVGNAFTKTYVNYGKSNGTAIATAEGGTPPYDYVWDTNPIQLGNTAAGLNPGTYTVMITDSQGCTLSARVELEFAPNQLYVPNAFSPNGDGINDEFNFSGLNISDIHIMIFDRWGEKLFETNNPEEHWDATNKGTPVDLGVYVYVIEAGFYDGQKIMKKGNVTVMR